MKPFLVLYATREGHTRRVAEHIADTLRSRGFASEIVDVASPPAGLSIADYCGAFIAASVHKQKHESEIIAFIKRHVSELERIPTAFLSVSLSEAGVEDTTAPEERRVQASNDAERMIDTFLTDTGWHPSRIRAVGGTLMYSKYRLRPPCHYEVYRSSGGRDMDTAKDYDYAEYKRLADFVGELTELVVRT